MVGLDSRVFFWSPKGPPSFFGNFPEQVFFCFNNPFFSFSVYSYCSRGKPEKFMTSAVLVEQVCLSWHHQRKSRVRQQLVGQEVTHKEKNIKQDKWLSLRTSLVFPTLRETKLKKMHFADDGLSFSKSHFLWRVDRHFRALHTLQKAAPQLPGLIFFWAIPWPLCRLWARKVRQINHP